MTEPQEQTVRGGRRSREEAARLVLEYEQSGLTRKAFCHQHGLSSATLDYYRKRIASAKAAVPDGAPSTQSITFVPLELTEQPAVVSQQAHQCATLFVELAGGRRIGVTSGFDAVTLTRLIAVLEQE
jgi:transposase-like protein